MATPTIAAVANDLGERCAIIIGSWGYWLENQRANGQPVLRFHPQKSKTNTATYISTSDHLTMRDAEDSRVFMNDWRRGSGQIAYLIDDVISKARFFDSTGCSVKDPGRITMVRNVVSNANGTSANTTALPLTVATTFLYQGDLSKVSYSTAWSTAPSTAATSGAGNVVALENDGQYVYGAVAGVGINRWAINSGSAGTSWNTTSTTIRRILWANRLIYAIDAANFYSITTGGTSTTQFTPPTGWTFQDLAAKRGGAIDSPILILATAGNRSFIWYWDGTTIHDYLALPDGFVGFRLKVYLGVTYISGYRLNPDASVSPCAYYIQNDTLGFLGYFGLGATNGNPTANGVSTAINYGIAAFDTFVYFSVSTTAQDVWIYDITNVGLTRFVQVQAGVTNTISDIVIYNSGPWVTLLGASGGLFNTGTKFVTTATLDTSDLHGGQPWNSNNWLSFEMTTAKLAAGESVAASYSIDGGGTYTSIGTQSTLASTSSSFKISSSTTTISNPYIRIRFTLTAGTSQATAPSVYSFALKFDPQDPAGVYIEAELACADNMYMPNGGPDWQGGSGSERIFNIENLYNMQAIFQVIYMEASATRGKAPKTISASMIDYRVEMYSGVGYGPNRGIEGTVHVELREVTLALLIVLIPLLSFLLGKGGAT